MKSRRCERCGTPIYGESALCLVCSGTFSVALLGYKVPASPPKTPSPSVGTAPDASEVDTGEIEVDVHSQVWSCLADADSCPTCAALDGARWLLSSSRRPTTPHAQCTSPKGCRCVIVSEPGRDSDPELTTFLESHGRFATPAEMVEYEATQLRKRGGAALGPAAMDEALETASAARELEKTEPEKAVEMYRSSIAVFERALTQPHDERLPSHVHAAFNRLTLTLERLRRDDEALAELDRHLALRLPPQGPRGVTDAMDKRRERLLRGMSRDQSSA
jgi:hypothetical protein